ncbi:MauE/DoxX family redox-associated membrane protein [Pedobacter nanyangensis]|uniref:MauE/DoxX family redox-associated membrane protein n=1 Tax=Pedobacter nanyangensis TaxID=1562389 RepID=UPI000DE27B01|nr:MauE/DoxX family redox-associated membrane protein [Pedobacter nanyangensis]
MLRRITLELITILFIVLWMYAGLSKLFEYDKFRFQLGRSPYIESMAGVIAWLLPLGEIVLAVLLVPKATRLLALYGSFFLMLLFTGYIYMMLHHSYFIPCSCGGILALMDWHAHLIFNVGFTVLALVGVLLFKLLPKSNSAMKIAFN